MEKNTSNMDRGIRVVIGVSLVVMGYYFDIWWLYLISAVLFMTALTGFCLLYKIFPKKNK